MEWTTTDIVMLAEVAAMPLTLIVASFVLGYLWGRPKS